MNQGKDGDSFIECMEKIHDKVHGYSSFCKEFEYSVTKPKYKIKG